MIVRAWLLLCLLLLLLGCVQPPSKVTYRQDAISIAAFELRPLLAKPEEEIYLRIALQNQVDRTIPWLEVELFSSPGFAVLDVSCEQGGKVESTEQGCKFYELRPFGFAGSLVEAKFRLKAPKLAGEYTLAYAITYQHSGVRIAHLPLLPEEQEKPNLSLKLSEPSPGPIRLEIELPVAKEEKVDKRVVKHYWVRSGEQFRIVLKFKHVGSFEPFPIFLEQRNLKVKLDGFEGCTELEPSSLVLPSKEGMSCELKAERVVEERVGTIEVEYNYVYSFSQSHPILIYPES